MGLSHSREVAWSAENGRLNDLKYHMVLAGPGSLKPLPSSVENRSPLHLAAAGGYTGCVQAIWEAGGDVNAEDKSGLTPLHLAVQNQHLRCAQLLLELGANIHTRTRNCVTPLHVAATSGNLPCVEAFLVRGAFINAQESWGQTPLVVATQKLRVEAMRTLLLHGADTEVKDFFHKQTALHCAASDNKSEEALLILLDAGCDVHARDGSGCSPLGVAVMHRFKRGASLLLEYGASLNEADKQKTPECSSLRRYVEEKSGTPRTLQQLCRVFVRKALSRVPPDKMSSFMLPEHIAQYIEAITLSDPESNCAPTTVTGLKQ